MGKIVSKARQVRLNYQARLGYPVSLTDVEEATGLSYAALSRIEAGKTERIDFETLRRLCEFYEVGVHACRRASELAARPLLLLNTAAPNDIAKVPRSTFTTRHIILLTPQ